MITLGLLKTEFANILANVGIADRIADWAWWTTNDIISSNDFWWNKKKSSFTTSDGVAEYFLSHRVNDKQVLWMGDESNQNREIKEVPLEQIYKYDSTPTDEGSPIVWAYVNKSEVSAACVSGTSTAVSTSASDLSTTVVIRGKVSGIECVETITLNGTTTATPSSALTWDADGIEGVNLSASCVGTVTVTVGGTTIAAIPAGMQRLQCPRIRLYRVPSSTLTLPYIFYQRAIKSTLDSDIIDLPDMAFDALRLGIEHIGHKNNGDYDFADKAFDRYQQAKAILFSRSTRELNQVIKKDFRRQSGVSFSLPRTITATVT